MLTRFGIGNFKRFVSAELSLRPPTSSLEVAEIVGWFQRLACS